MPAPREGVEWILDASRCDPATLRDRAALTRVFRQVVRDLQLHPIGRPRWHRFPRTGGLTGVWILAESHLSVHTFPEFGSLCLNLFCCRPRPRYDWRPVQAILGGQARIRRLRRRYTC